MRPYRAIVPIITAVALTAHSELAHAQRPGVTVRGVVFDSLHARPLEKASVMLAGTNRLSMSDARGRFVFDSVSPGTHTIIAYHAAIDSIGLGAISAKANIAGDTEIQLAIPSFATMWRVSCGEQSEPGDSGFVYGRVRDAATQRPLVGAQVTLEWVDLERDGAKRIYQKLWRTGTRSDSTGAYGICGVPVAAAPRIRASTDSASSGMIDMLGEGVRIRRLDLSVSSASSTQRGTITGVVTNADNKPVDGVRVVLDEANEARTNEEGRFTLRDVPAGTRQIQVLKVGMTPVVLVADVAPGGTTTIGAEIRQLTMLETVRVMGARQQFVFQGLADRKRQGFGFFADSTTIGNAPTIASALAVFPSVALERARRSNAFFVTLPQGPTRCVANLFIDGIRQTSVAGEPAVSYSALDDLRSEDIAAVEIYRNGSLTPMEFQSPWSSCGAVAIWTKQALRR